jgi:hypothetical protein
MLLGIAAAGVLSAFLPGWIVYYQHWRPRLTFYKLPPGTLIFKDDVLVGRAPLVLSVSRKFIESNSNAGIGGSFAVSPDLTEVILTDGAGQLVRFSFLAPEQTRANYVNIATKSGERTRFTIGTPGTTGFGIGSNNDAQLLVYLETKPED